MRIFFIATAPAGHALLFLLWRVSLPVKTVSTKTPGAAPSRLAFPTLLVAALCLALPAFPPSARADKRPKAPAKAAKKNAVKKALPAVKMIPPMETVSGLKRKIAELKAQAKAKREAENPGKDEDEAKDKGGKGREAEEEDGTDYYEAYQYYLQQRAYPKDFIDQAAINRAIIHRNALPAARIGGAGNGSFRANALTGQWQFIGPNKLAVPYRTYYGVGNLNGRIGDMAYDSTTPGTIYMATAGGGFWRSIDSGANWTPLSDGWQSLQTSCIAIDPTNHNTIYVGTGDFDGSGSQTFGIMKTLDGGATWTNLGKSQFGGSCVKVIAIDPENPQIITVAPGRGSNYYAYVWRSTNGGASFTSVLNVQAPWCGLSYSVKAANGSRHLYAIGLLYGGQVYRSDDRGVTWTKLSPPLTSSSFSDQQALRIAASAVDPQTVYIIDGHDQKLFVSHDAGATWADTTNNFSNQWTQSSYDIHLECTAATINSVPTDVLYVGLIDLSQSRDGGATWQSLGGPTYTGNAILHNDQHSLTINPNGSGEALVGCDGGTFRLTDNIQSNVWSFTSLNNTGGVTQFYRMAAHPTDPTQILGGAQDNASPVSISNLATWGNVAGGDGGFCAIKSTAIQFATSQNLGLDRTDNSWSSSYGISPNFGADKVAFEAPIALDAPANYLYAGTNYLYQYNIASKTWANRLGNQVLASNNILAINSAPSSPSRLYTGSDSGEVWTSGDAGATWTQINSGSGSAPLPNRAVTSFAPSPTAPTSVLAGVSGTGTGHLWRCLNVTAPAWQNVSGAGATALPDAPLNSIALDTDAPDTTWYVATDVGVFATLDAGAHWANMTAPLGLPNVHVNDLQMQSATRTLYAATYGRGIWKISTGPIPRTVSGYIILTSVPDPANATTPPGPVTVEFRTAGGGPVYTRMVNLASNNAFSFTDIPAGNYIMAAKAAKWLRATTPVDVTSGNVTTVTLRLPAGDANNDNIVDSTDFGLLVGAYNTDISIPGGGYDPKADFNCDGVVDSTDFALLIGNFNLQGAN